MATNISIPDDLLPKLEVAAHAENRTADDLVAEAIQQHLARLALERLKREAVQFRGDMTDEQVEEYVDKMVHEFRAENRS